LSWLSWLSVWRFGKLRPTKDIYSVGPRRASSWLTVGQDGWEGRYCTQASHR
jgi:hypothetical protein